MMNRQYKNIDEYIATYPENIQDILQKIRQAIKTSAPEATEAISYGMPTFKLNGNLVHFAAFKKHIGFFPTPSGVEAFKEELQGYQTSKGSIQFPLDKPVPYDLVEKIVKLRVIENKSKKISKAK